MVKPALDDGSEAPSFTEDIRASIEFVGHNDESIQMTLSGERLGVR